LIVWFVIGLTTTALLIAFAIALVRHGLVLGRAAKQMTDEAGPLARDIQRESERASAHAARLQPPRLGQRARRG
jgi:hypothetical protein